MVRVCVNDETRRVGTSRTEDLNGNKISKRLMMLMIITAFDTV